jgi:hypothetical protein
MRGVGGRNGQVNGPMKKLVNKVGEQRKKFIKPNHHFDKTI